MDFTTPFFDDNITMGYLDLLHDHNVQTQPDEYMKEFIKPFSEEMQTTLVYCLICLEEFGVDKVKEHFSMCLMKNPNMDPDILSQHTGDLRDLYRAYYG